MRRLLLAVIVTLLALGFSGRLVYASHTAFVSTDATSIGAITVPGIVPGPYVLGTYVSGGSDLSGTSPPDAWTHAVDSVFDSSAANALDYHWLQGTTTPVIWDLGSASNSALVFPSIDHGPMSPAPYEALEFTVWGSNDPAAVFPVSWTLATLTRVYADGWTDVGAAQESDDFASLWTFGGTEFQFIAVYANRSIEIAPTVPQTNQCSGEGVWCSFDHEIDAVGRPGAPVQELVMVVHGHGADADAIARDQADLMAVGGKPTYRLMVKELIDEFDQINVFRYVEDLAGGTGDSQSSVSVNSIKLAADIDDLLNDNPGRKVTLIGFSMGTAIIRGYLALFPDAEQKVDAVIFLEGAHQGAWLLKVRERLSLWSVASLIARADPTWFLFLTAVDAVVFEEFGIDVNRPAAADLTPDSEWYRSVNRPVTTAFDGTTNSEPVPPETSYFNFYGDIGVELEASLWRFRLRTPRVSFGDLVLLPGDDSPIATPLLGGARFVASVNPERKSEQWAMESPFRLNLESLRRYLRGEATAKEAISGLVDAPPSHTKIHDNMLEIMVDDRVSGGGIVSLAREIVEIVGAHPE